MFRKQLLCLVLATACLLGLVGMASGAEVECDSTYCFTQGDFSDKEGLVGICITGLPDPKSGTVMLGSRVLKAGDILTVEQIRQMTFQPIKTEEDGEALVTYLPIYQNRVESAATMTIAIKGKVDQAPVAEDQAVETYKNLPNTVPLKVNDPEGLKLTYTVTRQPRRGTVEVDENGSFTYTPKKNKVGTDSFTYTATDPAGNTSREATVTVRILKPGKTDQYSDTVGQDSRFAAEWLKNTGLFIGEQVGETLCFNANRPVSRGEFVAMAVQVLGIPVDMELTTSVYSDEIPTWLQPYLAAALRSGMTAGLPVGETGAFGAGENVTASEAAVILQNALDLAVSVGAMDNVDENVPDWAVASVAALLDSGIQLPQGALTRGEVAKILYRISKMTADAPGLQMYQ